MESTSRACPVCERHEAYPLYAQWLAVSGGWTGDYRQEVVICANCGGCFANTTLDQSGYDALYTHASRYAAAPAGPAERDDGASRFRDLALAVSGAVPGRRARVLDVGCANGQLLEALRDAGFEHVHGIDPSPSCVAQASTIPGVHAAVGTLSTVSAELGEFDVVILSHVLEHVREAREALERLKPLIAPEGVLYVEVPDASRYADYVCAPFQDFNSEHINHFSAKTLSRLLTRAGYSPGNCGFKVLWPAPGMAYPALYYFARTNSNLPAAVERDSELAERLHAYVSVCDELMTRIDTRLSSCLADGQRVIVWGTGELTAKLLTRTALARANVVAFVDGNPVNQGRNLRGLPILAPEQLTSGPDLIVIGSILHSEAIRQRIQALGLANPLLELVERHLRTQAG